METVKFDELQLDERIIRAITEMDLRRHHRFRLRPFR